MFNQKLDDASVFSRTLRDAKVVSLRHSEKSGDEESALALFNWRMKKADSSPLAQDDIDNILLGRMSTTQGFYVRLNSAHGKIGFASAACAGKTTFGFCL